MGATGQINRAAGRSVAGPAGRAVVGALPISGRARPSPAPHTLPPTGQPCPPRPPAAAACCPRSRSRCHAAISRSNADNATASATAAAPGSSAAPSIRRCRTSCRATRRSPAADAPGRTDVPRGDPAARSYFLGGRPQLGRPPPIAVNTSRVACAMPFASKPPPARRAAPIAERAASTRRRAASTGAAASEPCPASSHGAGAGQHPARDRPPGREACGRLVPAVAELEVILGRTGQVITQTRSRLGGCYRPRHHPGQPAGQPARPARPPDREGPPGQAAGVWLPGPRVDNVDGIVLDHSVHLGKPPDAPLLAPAIARIQALFDRVVRAVTADRGYGEAKIEQELRDLGGHDRGDPPQGQAGPGPLGPARPDGASHQGGHPNQGPKRPRRAAHQRAQRASARPRPRPPSPPRPPLRPFSGRSS
jgi:hypothetical protein